MVGSDNEITGTTPPPTPPTPVESPSASADEGVRPGILRRTLSLGRGDGQGRPQTGLLRRLSSRARPPTKEFNLENAQQRRFSTDATATRRPPENGDSYFAPKNNNENEIRPSPFHRRTTDLSTKAAKKANAEGDANAAAGFVNLERGLDITLNLEVNPKDPAGITTPYKLLVPALWYDGGYDPEPHRIVKGWRKWLGRGQPKRGQNDQHDHEYQEQSDQPDYLRQGHDGPHASDEEEEDDDEYYEDTHGHDDGSSPNHYGRGAMQQHSDSELDTPPKRRKWLGII